MGLGALILFLACTVGEPPPEAPGPEGGAGPAAETPGPEPRAGETPAERTARARELLERAERSYERAEPEQALALAEELIARYPSTDAAAPARWVAARAAFALERYGEAEQEARAVADAGLGPELEEQARELARLAEDARTAAAPVVVGAVLPRSGPRVLVRYADWLLEGIELAVAEAERRQNRQIELVVMDDSGGAHVRQAVHALEERGAVAIVGPLLPAQIAAAARARRDPRLVLVSPTSTESPRWPETFSINSSDPRGARELGRYAAALGFQEAAVLYARTEEAEGKATAFAQQFEQLGGVVRTLVPYDSGTTTFGPHMERILGAVAPPAPPALAPQDSAEAGPLPRDRFALFVAAPQRDVPQIAPQVSFYGLDSAGVRIFGDEAWASATTRRVVPRRDLEGVIAASWFPPDRAATTADPDFIRAYEDRYRRSLDNPLPALGYDAAHLVLQALPNRLLTPDALARRFELLAGIRGATGLLSVRASQVVRTPYLVLIQDGNLLPAPDPGAFPLGGEAGAPSDSVEMTP